MTYPTKFCWDCEIDQRSEEFVQRYDKAESRGDESSMQQIKKHHAEFLNAAWHVRAYDKQDGYKIHRANYVETGDDEELARMLTHPLPDESRKIKIIPLQPKAIGYRKSKPFPWRAFAIWSWVLYVMIIIGFILI